MKFYTHPKLFLPHFSNSLSATHLFYLACIYELVLVLGISGAAQMANVSGLRATLRQDYTGRYFSKPVGRCNGGPQQTPAKAGLIYH